MKPALHTFADSPLYEPLAKVGLDDAAIARLLRRFPQPVVREWVDITLAAQERFGARFFTRSPQAYLVDNVQKAVQGTRTPPDWWHDLRQAERQARRQGGSDELSAESRQVFAKVRSALFEPNSDSKAAGGEEPNNVRSAKRSPSSTAGAGKQPIRIGQLLR